MTAFLPLASNAGWFEGASLKESLGLRLKTVLLLEDELIADARGFHFSLARGEIVEQILAPANIPWDRTSPASVVVNAGPGGVEMKMDWQALLGALQGVNVRYTTPQISPQTRRSLRAEAETLARDPTVSDTLPGSPAVREAIVKHWLLDAASAALEGAAVAVDARAGAFVHACNAALGRALGEPERPPFAFVLPDLRAWPFDRIFELRASVAGTRLRNGLRNAQAAGASPQEEIDVITGRDPRGPGIEVVVLENRVPALMRTSLVGATPSVYVVGLTR